jgi:bifunctional DNA-binding transcriptional regulator/antitoxin component of YhaV-PrlF toxin-antitoxin module
MQFKTSVVQIGGTTYLLIPKEVRDFLNLEVGPEQVVLQDYEKSKGKFIAFWKNGEKK